MAALVLRHDDFDRPRRCLPRLKLHPPVSMKWKGSYWSKRKMEPQSTPNTQIGVCQDSTRGQANGPEPPVRYPGFCVFGVHCGSIFMGPSIRADSRPRTLVPGVPERAGQSVKMTMTRYWSGFRSHRLMEAALALCFSEHLHPIWRFHRIGIGSKQPQPTDCRSYYRCYPHPWSPGPASRCHSHGSPAATVSGTHTGGSMDPSRPYWLSDTAHSS